MTDSFHIAQPSAPAQPAANSAGALLRQYREAKGLHISILAASLKVPMSKLDALEANRLDELPDLVFARALAMSICRYLHQDPAPVLGLMPGQEMMPAVEPLVSVSSGMQRPMPMHAGASGYGRRIPSQWLMLGGALLAVLLAWAGLGFPGRPTPSPAPAPGVSSVLPPGATEPAPPVAADAAAGVPTPEPVAVPGTVVTPVQSVAVPVKPASPAQ